MIDIGSRRECFFDYYLIDENKTTAQLVLHSPSIKEECLVFDKEWEAKATSYPHFFFDDGKYKMYYIAYSASDSSGKPSSRVCYAESVDALRWIKPELGICNFNGSLKNNIVVDSTFGIKPFIDNFYVFRDDNPYCPDGEKYKGICSHDRKLWAFFSPDGLHFKKGCQITDKGAFDTLNIIFWDDDAGVYRGYIRGFHAIGDLEGKDEFDERPFDLPNDVRNLRVRDIRYIESKDFKTWSRPKLLDFGNQKDMPLYSNQVIKYERAPHIYIGFPTRYNERKEWTGAFDVLCGKEERLRVIKENEPRAGLAITDCLFMCSRDGYKFTRYDKAFITPGVEHTTNWVYGDCYPTHGLALAPSHVSSEADCELSFFCQGNHRSSKPNTLIRYAIRQDGFCSFHADGNEEVVTTKPFVFKGNSLYANMATSAAGYVYFELKTADGEVMKSCEMFGDRVDKLIGFDKSLQDFCGKEVVLTMRMCEADVYSIKFEDK